jgi:NADPH2:quinone reductase
VLHALGQSPRYEDFPEPQAEAGEVVVAIKAASLKNIDKMLASGSHYDRHAVLPCVCGVDGVGLLPDGSRAYCGGARPPYGMMAERTVVSRDWCLPVPDAVDDATVAALPNPALSSWLSLEWRARLQPGEIVLILGATGVAGQLSIQLARHLGAGRVVAAGRSERALPRVAELGADATIALDVPDRELVAAFVEESGKRPFDVILDYLWGRPTELVLEALTRRDMKAAASRTRLVQIGEMAGPTITLAAAALRSSGVELLGSGGGSVPHKAVFETFPKMWELASRGQLRIRTELVPLSEVESAWRRRDLAGVRLVFIP